MRRNSLVHSGNLALAPDQAQYRGLKFCAMKIAAFQPSGKGKKCGGRPATMTETGPAGVERDLWKPLPPFVSQKQYRRPGVVCPEDAVMW